MSEPINIPFEERVARVCHEANRAYCESIGDSSQKPWDGAEQWQRDSAIKGVQFQIRERKAGRVPPPDAQHNAWLADKKAEGWVYGAVKNPAAKQHPCMVAYEQLPLEQRMKDHLFVAICSSFIHAYGAEIGFTPKVVGG